MNTILKTATPKKYRGVYYRIDALGSYYECFDISPITKTEVCFASGAAGVENTYTDEYVQNVIDEHFKNNVTGKSVQELIYSFIETEYDEVSNDILNIVFGDETTKEESEQYLKQRINEFVEREI